jgi:hypothetical protein
LLLSSPSRCAANDRQIHLNYRHRTFAGSYALTAYLMFASLFCSHITKILVRWFGRSQLMQPLGVWDVVTLLVEGVVPLQAWRLPRVEQTVNEALD